MNDVSATTEPQDLVHLWAGTFPAEDRLTAFFHRTYDEDGDALPSEFMTDQAAEYVDRDAVERSFSAEPVSPRELADGHSYAEQWADAFADRAAAAGLGAMNALVLMLERPDDPPEFEPTDCRGGDYALHYLGAVPYRP